MKLPDFYVPWPARKNPHCATARTHAKAWAFEVGILSAEPNDFSVWEEKSFDRHDYADFCSRIHPEASVTELELMTDWNVWAFYVDDYFIKRFPEPTPATRAEAREYLKGIVGSLPLDLEFTSPADSPTLKALQNLWLRTAIVKPLAWRRRIVEDTKRLLDAFLWEFDNRQAHRVANPAEYIAMRRQVGAALWSADLVEHTLPTNVPERVMASRTLQSLRYCFADAVHLRNDIFSYHREVLVQGEVTNAVLVFERFLKVPAEQAMSLVNELLTSRLQQFEHAVITELPEVFLKYNVTEDEQRAVLSFVKGLQDWQSGAHEWHVKTSRYGQAGQTGQPKKAWLPSPATLGLQRFKTFKSPWLQKVQPFHLPTVEMPQEVSFSPHLEKLRTESLAWAQQMGFFDSLPEHLGEPVWKPADFCAADIARFCATYHPTSALERLLLDTCFTVLGTFSDDYFCQLYLLRNDASGARVFVERLSGLMKQEGASLIPLNPVERGLSDLWQKASSYLPTKTLEDFRQGIEGMYQSWLWELDQQRLGRIPDPVDYMEMRRITGGAYFIIIFPWLADFGQGVPTEFYQSLGMRELCDCAMDHAVMVNDLFSYKKELEEEKSLLNWVVVLSNFLEVPVQTAMDSLNALITARLHQFEEIQATKLPVLFDDFDLSQEHRQQVLSYVKDLRSFMASSVVWHQSVARYRARKEATANQTQRYAVSHLSVPWKSKS